MKRALQVRTQPARILIHALGADIGGGARHLHAFLPALADHDGETEYVVLVRRGLGIDTGLVGIRVREVSPAVSRHPWIRTLYDLLYVPMLLKHGRFAALVTLTNFGPIYAGVPHLCFQRNSLYFCPYFLARIGVRERLRTGLRRFLLAMAMRRASTIVTPSDSMAAMIRAGMPFLANRRFRTLYHGVTLSSMSEPLGDRLRQSLDAVTRPRLVYPSHLSFYKGFWELFEVLAAVRLRGLQVSVVLTIDEADDRTVVSRYRQRVAELGLASRVHFIGRVPQGQMGALYAECDAMVFPSRCESFGFPLLEALAHRLPVLASDTSVNREICGDAALYFDPDRPQQGADQLSRLLSGEVRAHMADAATARTSGYDWSWRRYAVEFTSLVQEAIR